MDVAQALLSPIFAVETKLLLIAGINRKATLVRRRVQKIQKKGEHQLWMNQMYLTFESYRTSLQKLSWMVQKEHTKDSVWEAPEWKMLHDQANATRQVVLRVMNIIIP
jgi:hypothetical protein